MSYEIVKGLTYEKETGNVYIRASSNNVFPKDFRKTLWGNVKEIDKNGEGTFESLELSLIKSDITNWGLRLEIPKYRRAIAKTRFEHSELFIEDLYKDEKKALELAKKVQDNIGKTTKGEFLLFIAGVDKTGDLGFLKRLTKHGFKYTPSWFMSRENVPQGTRVYKCFEDALDASQRIYLQKKYEFKIFKYGDHSKYFLRKEILYSVLSRYRKHKKIDDVFEEETDFVLISDGERTTLPKKIFPEGYKPSKDIEEIEKTLLEQKYDYVSKLKAR